MLFEVTTWFRALPFNLQVYLGLALLFLLVSMLFVLIIQISQLLKRADSRYKRRYIEEIQREISQMVIQSSMSEIPDAAFRYRQEKLVKLKNKSPYLAQLIMDEIVSMKKNLVGESAQYLKKAYLEMGLLDVSLKKVKSKSWKRIAKGLRELEIMEQVDSLHHFIIFLNHPNYYLRREARLSLAGLAPNPMFFLEEFKESLSDWEKLLLFEKIKRRPQKVIPDFSQWYEHSNMTVVTFCIEMTVQFGQVHNVEKLGLLLKTSRDQVRCLIIDALNRMEAIQHLKDVVVLLEASTSSRLILSCLKFIGSIGDDSHVNLILPFTKHQNPYVRLEAVNSLHELGYNLQINDPEVKRMFDHIKHPLIA